MVAVLGLWVPTVLVVQQSMPVASNRAAAVAVCQRGAGRVWGREAQNGGVAGRVQMMMRTMWWSLVRQAAVTVMGVV